MANSAALTTDLTQAQFIRISGLVKDMCGINLHDGKMELVRARLNKRLRKLGITSFDDYLDYVSHESSGRELVGMLDALTTNLTSFFREASHFDYLANGILAPLASSATKRLRIWCAGCSTGEEPYCIAMTMREMIPDLDRWDAKILDTDLSTEVLAKAARGVYSEDKLKTVPPQMRHKYFQPSSVKGEKVFQVSPSIRKLVSFARLNLMESWPMSGPFDVIFCRNVMIYFDKPTQGKLVRRYCEILRPQGTLFIGHSESLTGVKHQFKYVEPTVYEKV